MRKASSFLLLLLAPLHLCIAQGSKPADPQSSALMAFERDLESAAARGDVEFLRRGVADDFTFTHGDAWRTGEKPARVDTKQSWLNTVAETPGER